MKFLLAILLLLISTAHAGTAYMEWSFSDSAIKQGQALVIHGLNSRPEKMSEIIDALNKHGHDVLLLKLIGHNNDLSRMKKVTYDQWNDQILAAFNKVVEKNCNEGGKITLVGYSLGAVLAMDMLANNPQLKAHQTILFSPAISVKNTSYFVKAFGVFGKGFVVPSFSSDNYKAQNGTTVAAYRALFETIASFEKGDLSLLNIPTLVFVDKKDELVSYKGLKEIAKQLDKWKLVTVTNKNTTMKKSYHHLTITEESLGADEWNNVVMSELDKFLVSNKLKSSIH
jgi:esterase/lipase